MSTHVLAIYYSFFSTLSSSFYSALSSSFITTPDIITIDSCWLSLVESLIFNKGVTSFFKNQWIDKWYLSSLPFFKDIIDYPCVIVGCWEDHHPSPSGSFAGCHRNHGKRKEFLLCGRCGALFVGHVPIEVPKRPRSNWSNPKIRVKCIGSGFDQRSVKMMTESHLRDSQGPHVVDVRFHIMSPHIA